MVEIPVRFADEGFSAPYKPNGTAKPDGTNAGQVGEPKPDPIGDDNVENRSEESSSIAGINVISPSDLVAGTRTGKRRGRKPRPRDEHGNIIRSASEAKQAPNLNPLGIESILLSIHAMGASIIGAPELKLEPGEAKELSNAIVEVSKHYNTVIDPKKMAIFQLVTVAGSIYGSKAVAIYRRKTSERKTPKPDQVIQPKSEMKTSPSLPITNPSQIYDEMPLD